MPPNTLDQKPLRISVIPHKYPKQWVTVDITEWDQYGLPFEGRVILNSKIKKDVFDKMKSLQGKNLYIFYTGRIDDDIDKVHSNREGETDN